MVRLGFHRSLMHLLQKGQAIQFLNDYAALAGQPYGVKPLGQMRRPGHGEQEPAHVSSRNAAILCNVPFAMSDAAPKEGPLAHFQIAPKNDTKFCGLAILCKLCNIQQPSDRRRRPPTDLSGASNDGASCSMLTSLLTWGKDLPGMLCHIT